MKCCLCNGKLPKKHPGRNNPYPLKTLGACCNDCNSTRVIPARLRLVRKQFGGKK